MDERDFIVGIPYRKGNGCYFNLVKNNRTRIISCSSLDQANYLSDLVKLLYDTGIDFSK